MHNTFRRWRWSCRVSGRRSRFAAHAFHRSGRRAPRQYGNLYGTLLDYVVFAVLIFYILTIAGVFVLRRKRPNAERPYRAFGYPLLPALYIVAATIILLVLALYRTQTIVARPADRARPASQYFSCGGNRDRLTPCRRDDLAQPKK